jgi:FMN phosphatase YigB (HAD superfamily)
MDFKKIKLLIVDLDNTLCDTFHTLSKSQWERAAKVLESKGYAQHAKVFRKNFGKHSFKYTMEQLKLPKKERDLAVHAYDSVSVTPLKLYDDAHGILDLAIPKVLVTRGEKSLQLKKLKHLKLRKYFGGIYHISTFQEKAVAFKEIIKTYKLKPSEVLVIGDRIEEEILDANKLKMPSCLVLRPNWPIHKGVAKPTITVKSLYVLAKKLPRAK